MNDADKEYIEMIEEIFGSTTNFAKWCGHSNAYVSGRTFRDSKSLSVITKKLVWLVSIIANGESDQIMDDIKAIETKSRSRKQKKSGWGNN